MAFRSCCSDEQSVKHVGLLLLGRIGDDVLDDCLRCVSGKGSTHGVRVPDLGLKSFSVEGSHSYDESMAILQCRSVTGQSFGKLG